VTASWTVLLTADGSPTLVHPVHGEACHSRAGAWQEARERYAVACGLAALQGAELRLHDVGAGLGFNIAAALEALAPAKTSLRVVTLERDARVLSATLELARSTPFPPEIERWHAPVRAAMTSALAGAAEATLGSGSLSLHLGDARDILPRLPRDLAFDAVFLDPFSPRVEPELWQPSFLREVASRMAPGSRLSTYSASMSVRAGLLAAGLRVGPGARDGTKSSGTLASPDKDPGRFDARTQRRLAKRASDLAGAPGLEPARDSSPGERLRADR
jgi:tRNA U34 5-methylaminomethyl-2-thiouridine-forming methyltransferase MnmC